MKTFFKSRQSSVKAFLMAVLMACASTGCCKKSDTPVTGKKQLVRLNLKNEPATLDPRKGGDVISSHMHFLLFEGLVRLNPDGSITPAQAETFTVSEDGKVYTFMLRDAVWSNGTPVTAYDFEKAWKDILDPAFPSVNAHLLYPIKNAEGAKKGKVPLSEVGIFVRDAQTLIVTLDKPTPYFLDLVSFCVFFPVSAQNDKAFPQWAHNAGEHFISNGPFILKEWKHNNEIIVERNPMYWDPSRIRGDEIHFSMVDNEMTALQMFENKELDMIGEPLSPLPLDALPSLQKKGILNRFPVGGTTMITFNVDQVPFNNAKVRRAFAYAINRGEIVKNITQMGETPALNAVPPILKNNKNLSFFRDADAQAATRLLEEGLKEIGATKEIFNGITYYYSSSDMNHKVAQAVQQQWQKVFGIRLNIENLDHKILMDKLTKRDYLLAQSLWVAQYNDQMNILERFKFKSNAKNYANWENSEYIRLIDESFYHNGAKRAEILEQAETIFLNEMPICPIYHWEMVFAMHPHLSNVAMTAIGDIVFEKLEIEQRKSIR
jgi:oligopeptide transport system substrate-binding protein